MRVFVKPMLALSVLPAAPILLVGAVIAFDGFWNAVLGDSEQLAQLFMWALGMCGAAGLIIAGLETTYRKQKCRILTLMLIACGMIAVSLSFYYVFFIVTAEYNVGNKSLSDPFDRLFHIFSVIWLLLIWPFFSGLGVIKNILFD